MTKKKLEEYSALEMDNIVSEIMNSDYVFNCSWKQLAKHFIAYFTDENIWQSDFETTKKIFKDNVWFWKKALNEEISERGILDEMTIEQNKKLAEAEKDEEMFYRFVCKEHLDIEELPKDVLLHYYNEASKDLSTIDETLKKIDARLSDIKKEGDKLTIQDECPILYYYQKHNQDAQSRIIRFITSEIKGFVRKKQALHGLSATMFITPYHYYKETYKPRRPNVLDNKFLNIPVSEHNRLKKLLKDDREDFDKEIKKYIEVENTVYGLRDTINYSHIFNSRKEFIHEALDLYENGKFILFVNSIPSFIEGVFHDICLLFGYSENELQGDSFQAKLDKLQEHLGWELHYEYYSFSFRLLRNRISHGKLTPIDVAEYADLLLLDIAHMFSMVNSMKIPLNNNLFLIHEIETNVTNLDYHYLLDYLIQKKEPIPDFYGITPERLEKINSVVLTPDFWAFIENEKRNMYEAKKHGLLIIMQKIRSIYPDNEESKALLKELKLKKAERYIADPYLEQLTKDNKPR